MVCNSSVRQVPQNRSRRSGLSMQKCMSSIRLTVFRVDGFRINSSFRPMAQGQINHLQQVQHLVAWILNPIFHRPRARLWPTTRAKLPNHTNVYETECPITRHSQSRSRIRQCWKPVTVSSGQRRLMQILPVSLLTLLIRGEEPRIRSVTLVGWNLPSLTRSVEWKDLVPRYPHLRMWCLTRSVPVVRR